MKGEIAKPCPSWKENESGERIDCGEEWLCPIHKVLFEAELEWRAIDTLLGIDPVAAWNRREG